jgi:NAD(P)-dependent dehydrogenase (short-subunit alcohol dehydrogenase family)
MKMTDTEKWTQKDIPDLKGKNIIITGGNSGLGFESVKAFAEKEARVILTTRSMERGTAAKNEIIKDFPNAKIEVYELDLGNLDSVEKFSSRIHATLDKLDVLMNNAGIMMSPYFKTQDGFEGQMGTNHLGHFALTGRLLPLILKTDKSRVVTVSSNAHKRGKMDFNNLLFEDGKDYSPIKAYGRSKLANLLFGYELQRRFEKHKVNGISLAAHPGASQTNLARYMEDKWWFPLTKPLLMLLTQSAAMGALPQIRASVDPEAKGGEYYGPGGFNEMKGHPVKVKSNEDSHNPDDAKKLWKESEKITGINYNF